MWTIICRSEGQWDLSGVLPSASLSPQMGEKIVSFNYLRSYAPWWPSCKCLHLWSRDQGHVNTGLTVSRGHVGHADCINLDVTEATQVNIIAV